MRIEKRIRSLFDKHGIKANLIGPSGEHEIRCLIQPMRYKNKMFIDSQYTKVGIIDESCFLYLGPPEYDLAELIGTQLFDEFGRSFSCVKTEKIYLGNIPLYNWAILRLGE